MVLAFLQVREVSSQSSLTFFVMLTWTEGKSHFVFLIHKLYVKPVYLSMPFYLFQFYSYLRETKSMHTYRKASRKLKSADMKQ